MKLAILIFALVSSLLSPPVVRAGETFFTPFTPLNYVELGLSTASLVVDWGTTHDIANHPGYYETNPVLGPNPSYFVTASYFTGAIVLNALIGYALPRPYRDIWFFGVMTIQAITISNNVGMGLGISF